jgi:acetyl-CoA carboxylase biotin carboxyl carrier protein
MTVEKSFTQQDVEQILRVVDGLTDVEVRLEVGDMKLHVRKFSGRSEARPTPALAEAPASAPRAALAADARPAEPAPASAPVASAGPAGAVAIRAPMLGTFYRAPSPAEPAFVEPGSHVRAGDPVCIIEVMKLFNTVNAGVTGTIVSVVAESGQMVEQDDVLFYVKVDA